MLTNMSRYLRYPAWRIRLSGTSSCFASANRGLETVALAYKEFPTTQPDKSVPLIITHGVFGSKNNWNSIAKALQKSLNIRILTVDSRNHGDSPHTKKHDYQIMNEDFARLLDDLSIEKAIFLGHSMGGRTGMIFALNHPDRLEKLIVVDVALKITGRSTVLAMMNFLYNLKWDPQISLSSVKKALDAQLTPHIKDVATRQFLLTNLVSEGGLVKWKCNIEGLAAETKNWTERPTYPATKFYGPVLFIAGGSSHFLKEDDMITAREYFPKAQRTVVPNAGHNVHADNPQEFLKAVVEFISPNRI